MRAPGSLRATDEAIYLAEEVGVAYPLVGTAINAFDEVDLRKAATRRAPVLPNDSANSVIPSPRAWETSGPLTARRTDHAAP